MMKLAVLLLAVIAAAVGVGVVWKHLPSSGFKQRCCLTVLPELPSREAAVSDEWPLLSREKLGPVDERERRAWDAAAFRASETPEARAKQEEGWRALYRTFGRKLPERPPHEVQIMGDDNRPIQRP